MMPGNATERTEITTYRMRTAFGLHPSHSAIPPQTPAIILCLFDRRRGIFRLLFHASIVLRRYVELRRWLRSDRRSYLRGCARSAESAARIPIWDASIRGLIG